MKVIKLKKNGWAHTLAKFGGLGKTNKTDTCSLLMYLCIGVFSIFGKLVALALVATIVIFILYLCISLFGLISSAPTSIEVRSEFFEFNKQALDRTLLGLPFVILFFISAYTYERFKDVVSDIWVVLHHKNMSAVYSEHLKFKKYGLAITSTLFVGILFQLVVTYLFYEPFTGDVSKDSLVVIASVIATNLFPLIQTCLFFLENKRVSTEIFNSDETRINHEVKPSSIRPIIESMKSKASRVCAIVEIEDKK